jgi:hypothetical protein
MLEGTSGNGHFSSCCYGGEEKFEECFSESLVQIKGQWDRVNRGDIENAALRAWISQLESEPDRQANSSI